MKKVKVLSPIEKQRILSGTFIKYVSGVLLFLFLLPYVITALFQNIENGEYAGQTMVETIAGEEKFSESIYVENITAAGSEKIPLEIYLMDKLSRTISGEYEQETLRAQAVLLRTAAVEQLWSRTGSIRGGITLQDEEYGYAEPSEAFVTAVYATRGVFLTYQGIPAKAPYFAVSNGETRSGKEVLGTEAYPYLAPVSCEKDFLAEKFTQTRKLRTSEFVKAWEKATGEPLSEHFQLSDLIITRDSSDYITEITYQKTQGGGEPKEVTLSGEECRVIWGLDSACFKMEEENQKVSFWVKGVGHGLGLSQFTANEMSKSKSDYVEILEYFFSGTQLTKIE